MSVAPLVEQHEAEITKFYVRPPMMAYNKPNAFGQKKQSDEKSEEEKSEEKTSITSYRELLLNGSDPYKGIYVTADAGMGKTSFAKMLAITWCEAHASKDRLIRKSLEKNDIETMEKFDFLFFIKLRDFETSPKCSLDEMILEMMKSKLPHKSQYTEELLEKILCNKRCLIIVDGLDEWIHPEKCRRGEVIPHRRPWPKCTVLTTTRPWKLSSAQLSKSDIDRQVEISELDETTARELESRAIAFLNENQESPTDQLAANSNTKTMIVDGLDEWRHPKSCERGEVIPDRKQWPGCTVLTTTRPWKLSSAQLSKADIDRQVEISQLDVTTARKLESRAIAFLNENQETQTDQVAAYSNRKRVSDFEKSVPKQILGHILYIPFVLLQIICLWFGNNHIGKSLCEVYSNIIELTLTRWLVKTDSGHTGCKCEPSREHENIKLRCMENNRHCQCYMPLLLKIGELAFSTQFNVIREESLLFDKKQVLKYLSEEELVQCLKMGLLSQVKDTTSLTEVRLQLYFPHKTLHEFFSSLFIATNWNNADTGTMSIKQTISNRCTSVSDILEMSEAFMFVCGLNPEVYSDISRYLATIVSRDQRVIDHRNGVVYSGLLKDYQRMQIPCFLESTRNQHPECKIVLEDMFLYGQTEEDEQQALVKILSNSACSLKSLDISSYDKTKDSSLAGEIVQILSCLAHTLKYLKLHEVSLTDDMWSAISTMNLESLDLDRVQVSRGSLIVLTLPLLTKFNLWGCDLRDSTVTLTLPLLTTFTLRGGYLRDSTVTLSPEMTSLETITLVWTTVNIPCCKELFLSISKLPQPITVKLKWIDMTAGEWRELLFDTLGKLQKSIHVELQGCEGPPWGKWRNIVDDMKASPAFCVTHTDLGLVLADITFDTVVL